MTRLVTLTIALLFAAIGTFQYAGTASGQAGGGWVTLFDGKNLDHWQGDGTATFRPSPVPVSGGDSCAVMIMIGIY